MQALDLGSQPSTQGTYSMVCKWGFRFGWRRPQCFQNSITQGGCTEKEGQSTVGGAWPRALTLRLLRWMSPMELATVFGPKSMRVLRGHSVLTRWCSPMRILRTFSAPVTRISGRPSKCVLNTLPYFSLREDWKPEPCGSHTRDLSQSAHHQMGGPGGPASRPSGGGSETPPGAPVPCSPRPHKHAHTFYFS